MNNYKMEYQFNTELQRYEFITYSTNPGKVLSANYIDHELSCKTPETAVKYLVSFFNKTLDAIGEQEKSSSSE